MNIIVVNYDELNYRPSEKQVLGDICRLYVGASQTCREEMGKVLNEQLSQLSSYLAGNDPIDKYHVIFTDTSNISKRNHLLDIIKDLKPDLLVSYNLAGFELSTLADSLLYNLINCRQFHIIRKKNLPNEKYLKILRSINLFLFEDYKD